MINNDISVDGNKGGIIIRLNPADDFTTLKKHLQEKVKTIDGALMGSLVEVDIGHKFITRNEAQEIGEILARNGLQLKCITGRKTSTGLARENETKSSEPLFKILTREKEYSFSRETVLIRRNLRSGQKIYHPGNIVVMGDINPGAEVVAGGSILVMGALRGMAHAGAEGDSATVVAALKLRPTQLRIANHITRSPDDAPEYSGEDPEIAHIKDGKVVIEKFKI